MDRDVHVDNMFIATEFAEEQEYWLNKLSGDWERSIFPYDMRMVAGDKRTMEIFTFRLPHELFLKVTQAINQSDYKLHVILTAGLSQIINKYLGCEDIIIGTPIDRQEVDADFINTFLVLRNNITPGMTFKELLSHVGQTISEACDNQNYPLETLPYELNRQIGEDSDFPLFDVALMLENIHEKRYIDYIKFNVLFSFYRAEDFIEGKVEYNSSLYLSESIERISRFFVHLLKEGFSNPSIPIDDLDALEETERKHLLKEMNETRVVFPGSSFVHELFEVQVGKKPDGLAVEEVDTGRLISYKELNHNANCLAELLIEKGLKRGMIAAVMGERTGDIIASILAILKAGGVFLPLDAQNPDERIDFILKDSCAHVLLTQKNIIEIRREAFLGILSENIIAMDDEEIYKRKAGNVLIDIPDVSPAYIIYTSGTTGKPKGVIVEHKSLVNYVQFAKMNYVKEEDLNFPLYTSISFDLTITSMFVPLVSGDAVIVYGGWNKGNLIERIIDDGKVGLVKLTPSHLSLIREKKMGETTSAVKRLIVGGENLESQLAQAITDNFNRNIEIFNEYGPTEATVGCMLYKFDPEEDTDKRNSVSIGGPASNTQIYLLDKNLRPVPKGAVGEILISGVCVARGYLNRPELTSEKFLNPSNFFFLKNLYGESFEEISTGGYLYRTGDLARWLEEDNIEFLGRIDHQVKVRGFRIELGEIETRLKKYESVREAVVTTKEMGGDNHLCAYFVSSKELNNSELREYLSRQLPDYMIPSYFVRMDSLPLTPNGKVDMKALHIPETKAEALYVAPRDETEKKLVGIWAEILGLNAEIIGIDSNFFELGGHSLSGTVLNAKIQKVFNVKLALVDLFRLPNIRELARLLEESMEIEFIPIEPAEEKEYYPLSSAQERLFIIQQMELDSIGYNVPMIYEIEGKLNVEKLHNVFSALIDRHEILRTSFILLDNKPVQWIHKRAEFEIECFDVTGMEHSSSKEVEIQRIINLFIRPFDFLRSPLLRAGLIQTEQRSDRCILMIDIHHIITDGVSMDILIKEIRALYSDRQLSPLKLHYKDFSEWQNSAKIKEEMMAQEAYWLKKFEGEIPVIELPIDFPRPPFQSFEGDRLHFNLDKNEITGLRELATAQGVTLFMVILSIYNIFLAKLSGQDDIIIGSPIAGRRHADLDYIVGIFINTLALRNYLQTEKSFLGFLQEVKVSTLDAFENQEYQYEDLVTKISVRRDLSRNPLVDVILALNNVDANFLDIPEVEITGVKMTPYTRNFLASKVDLLLNGYENSEDISFSLEYATKLFKQETIRRFIVYFRQIISNILANPKQKIWEIEILPDEEKKQLLLDFNDTVTDYPAESTIPHLFEEVAEKKPDSVALIVPSTGETIQTSYRQLNARANRLANVLREKGVQPGAVVGLMVHRSIEMFSGILGILKVGGAYLPIDMDYPQERIDYMLKDSAAGILLTNELLMDLSEQADHLDSRNSMNFSPLPTKSYHLAYIIYTSGSTGKPKGVAVEHQGVVDYLWWAAKTYIKGESCNFPFYTSISFDLTVTSVFAPLVTGNSVVVYDDDAKDFLLDKIIDDNRVEVIKLTPSHLKLIRDKKIKMGTLIKRIIVGGEELETQLAEEIFRVFNGEAEIYNEYGPTETVVGSMIYKFVPGSDDRKTVLIGIPADNTRIYILDKNRNLVPIGVPGEIYIAGDGVARGYLNRPDLTLEKFVENPFEISSRMYRTGDLGRWLSDGNIEFLGRIDRQVKIRGYRLELGEIEGSLKSYDNVADAVVIPREDGRGDKYLCAYYVDVSRTESIVSTTELRNFLLKVLPDYMIPSFFVKLEKIPLTANGKIDRSALPDPVDIIRNDDTVYISPTNPVEKKLVEIWEKVLGRNNIGINDNFFLVGGDSIKSIQIISRMNHAGYKLEMKDIFQYPVISELALHVRKLKRTSVQGTITGTIPLTPIQRAFFQQSHIDHRYYNQAVMLYSRKGFDKEIIKEVFSKIQMHHDALRMTYKRNSDDNDVVQTCEGLDYPLSLEEYDLKGLKNSLDVFATNINEIQANIDLEKGPLMKLGLFRLDDGDRLLIVIHHLVIDSVSWRILLEDINILYNRYKQGETPALPAKTDSYRLWSERLVAYANSQSFLKEKSYWSGLESYTASVIPKDFEVEENFVKDTRSISFNLGEKETALLLTRVNEAFKTEVNDILLTALGLSIQETFGLDRVLLALEGHGREDILEDMDVSRTVGWFTSVYPVLMEFSFWQDTGRQIKEIKEILRKVPNKGVGYGILKYLTAEEYTKNTLFKLSPKISFNYLGQVDADIDRLFSFELAKESVGNLQGKTDQREYELDIRGVTANKRLAVTIYYNGTHFKAETMEAFAVNIETSLRHIIEFCCSKEKTEFTPSDFTCEGLSIESVDRLVDLYPNVENICALTPMQEGLLFHALVDDSSYSYFEQMSYRLHGELDIYLVEKSLNELIKRHEILRTAFVHKNIDRPVQLVLKNGSIDFHYEDISKLEGREERESFIKAFLKKDKDRSFDLSKGILTRVSILQVDVSEYEITWSFHHIVMDGWCVGILNAEFFEIYSALRENRPYLLPTVNPFRTYIQWIEKQDKEISAMYWKNYLDSFEEQTGIPGKRIIKRGESDYKNEQFSIELGREKTYLLNRLAAMNHVTMNIVAQVLWGILLGKYNWKEDVVFGAVVSGRPFELEGVESMVGLFINTIPVRIRFDERMKLNTLFRKIQEEALASEPHHYHPLAEIQAGSNLKQSLIDHLFAFENFPLSEQLEGFGNKGDKNSTFSFELTSVNVFEQIHYDFNIVLSGTDRLKITFRYNGNVFDGDFVERIANHFCLVFDRALENEEREIGDLIIVSDPEKKQLLYDFNDTEAGYPKDKTIHQLFEEQVERTSAKIALVLNDRQISYRELNEKANNLAWILKENGIGLDSIACIMLKRSIEMIVGIMGILKAGSAYLPVDPAYPAQRIRYMLEDSEVKLLLTYKKPENDIIFNHQVIYMDDLHSPANKVSYPPAGNPLEEASGLAYVIYTSGTTGRPKGALIEHVNVVRLLFTDRKLFDFNDADVWTMFHSYCFDFSVWEMYGALLYGGKLNIIPKDVTRDPGAFLTLLKQNCVTILNQTPSAFYNLITEELSYQDRALNLRTVIFGGEALSPTKLKAWKEKYSETKLINMFGITETTVHVTYKEITEKEIDAGTSCIGTPIPTLSTYILDRGLQLVPIGVPGELCVGGSGVGRGYLNRPELSHEKFIENPFKGEERLYRSGDLAKLSSNGEMEYLGRIDQQFQIRGFRVEGGEIENRLLKHRDIKDAVVIARKDKDSNIFLIAYIVSGNELPVSLLREFLSYELPEYMIPSYFVRIPQIPLTPNGKIDKSKLPEPDAISGEAYSPPANKVEEELLVAWKDVLKSDRIGVNDNFFNIGGDSIKAIRLVNSINDRLQVNIKILDLFTNNTIRDLAQVVNSGISTPPDRGLEETEKEVEELKTRIMKSGKIPEDVEDVFPMSDVEKGMIFHAYQNPDEAIYHDQFVYHRKFPFFEPDLLRKALDLLAEKHSILRTSFNVDDFNEFVHIIHKPFPAAYNHFDISELEKMAQEKFILKYMIGGIYLHRRFGGWRLLTVAATIFVQSGHFIMLYWMVGAMHR
jgi:bacitracin synthase 1